MRNIVSPLDGIRSPFGRRLGAAPFSPASLFAANEQGVWYDPSDFSTMFQDAAGTTPVTAVEQPVGLILDKSKGLVRNELLTNGTFATDASGWTTQNATAGVSGGQVTLTNTGANGGIYQAIPTVVGRTYFVSIQLVSLSGGGNVLFFIKSDSTNWASPNRINMVNGSSTLQTYTQAFTATATTSYIHIINGSTSVGHSVTVDNASVIDVLGNHAFQATAASRPVLSARVNLLTYTEQFDDAAWTKNASSIGTTIAAPNGSSTAVKLVEDNASAEHVVQRSDISFASGVGYSVAIYAKAAERNWLYIRVGNTPFGGVTQAFFNLSNGTVGTQTNCTGSITSVGNGWYLCKATATTTTSGTTPTKYGPTTGDNTTSYTGDGTSGVYIWGADLRVANDGVGLPAYQRVGAATDYDTTGFPYYLRFDGTDDSMSTGNIDFTATDKMSVFAGVRKLSEGSSFYAACIAELSASSDTTNGSFLLFGRDTFAPGYYEFGSRGTTFRLAATNDAAYAAPITNVLTGLADISGDSVTLRVNGTQVAQTTTDQGTGNYGNHALYVGRRNNASLQAHIRLYSLIVRGAATDAATSTSTETWVNGKTKAF